jgi:alkane 1-monooxygenase
MTPWIYLRYLFLPALVVLGWLLGGWWNFLTPVLCFVVHPIYCLIQKSVLDRHEHDVAPTHPSVLYRLVALSFVPVLLLLTSWATINSTETTAVEFTGLFISVGIINGVIGFTLIHEFIHRRTWPEKIAARLLMLQNNYPHYGIEHVSGHHIYACTPKDPHTARINESVYHFLVRSLLLTAVNSWEIEKKRLIKKRVSVCSAHNRLLQFIVLHASCCLLLYSVAGWISLLFYFAQSIVAIILSHLADYLQHYGLARIETSPGKFEKVSGAHAWNKEKTNDGFNLFQLENHADHHMHPSHSYEQLTRHEESPTLPTGYSGMIVLSLLPPLWFSIMNKRISSFTNKTMQYETNNHHTQPA